MRELRLAVAVLATACGGGERKEAGGVPDRVEVGAPAPAYSSRSLAGDSVSLASLRGKVVLLNVWATWCHPCRTEIPELEALYQRHRARGLEIIGVSVDAANSEDAIRDFMREYRMTYPVWVDPDERVSARFLVLGVPATFLIDRGGVLRWRTTGPLRTGDPQLGKAIEAALGA